jgi:hypothetical protein
MSKKLPWLLLIYFILFLIYAVFSYSLTAPNLILSSNDVFWKFQTYMWQTFFNDRRLLSYSYLVLISFIYIIYFLIIKKLEIRNSILSSNILNWKIIIAFILIISPLLISNNALSYDVFNYIFNAKMVLIYHANPHVKVALDFAYDDWTRFMHNTHTPAPYGYGWTFLSLLPYSLGMGKFLPTWIIFRLFSLLSIILLFFTYELFKKKKFGLESRILYFVVLLNPLLLIEVISNSHNDLWMMVPAMLSLYLINQPLKKKDWLKVLLSILLLAFSISTKFATALLIPIWLILIGQSILSRISNLVSRNINNWPLLASVLMFLPLLLSRSQQFHPWYLTWSLVWIPLFPANKISQLWRQVLIVLSIASLYRYLPYLWWGEYSTELIFKQKLITWIPTILFLLFSTLLTFKKKNT